MTKCPVRKIPNKFDCNLGMRPAIYVPFPQAVPNTPVIDRENCIKFKTGKCGLCQKVCGPGAVDYEQADTLVVEAVGAIVVATGFDLYTIDEKPKGSPIKGYGEFGHGRIPDVIDGMTFERLASASGPTGGKILLPSDGREPKQIVFIQCIGSRAREKGISYCSKVCCMYTAKHTMLYHHKVHDGQAYVFFMDARTPGKSYDEFWRRSIEEEEAVYIRGMVSRLYQKADKIVVMGSDIAVGVQVDGDPGMALDPGDRVDDDGGRVVFADDFNHAPQMLFQTAERGAHGVKAQQSFFCPLSQVEAHGGHVAGDLCRSFLEGNVEAALSPATGCIDKSCRQGTLPRAGGSGNQDAAAAVIALFPQHRVQLVDAGGESLGGDRVIKTQGTDGQHAQAMFIDHGRVFVGAVG